MSKKLTFEERRELSQWEEGHPDCPEEVAWELFCMRKQRNEARARVAGLEEIEQYFDKERDELRARVAELEAERRPTLDARGFYRDQYEAEKKLRQKLEIELVATRARVEELEAERDRYKGFYESTEKEMRRWEKELYRAGGGTT